MDQQKLMQKFDVMLGLFSGTLCILLGEILLLMGSLFAAVLES